MKTITCLVREHELANMEQFGLSKVVQNVNDVLRYRGLEVAIKTEATNEPSFLLTGCYNESESLRMQFILLLDACINPPMQESLITVSNGYLYFCRVAFCMIPPTQLLANIQQQLKKLHDAFQANQDDLTVWQQLSEAYAQKSKAERYAEQWWRLIVRIPGAMLAPIAKGEDQTSVYAHLYHIADEQKEKIHVAPLYEQAIAATEGDTNENRALLLLYYAGYLYDENQEEKATEIYRQAMRLLTSQPASSVHTVSTVAYIMNRLGNLYRWQGDLDTAEQYQQEALHTRQQLASGDFFKYAPREGDMWFNLSFIDEEREDTAKQIEHLQKALDIFVSLAKANPVLHAGDVADMTINLALALGDDEKAKHKVFETARPIVDQMRHSTQSERWRQALIYQRLSQIYQEQKRDKEAEELLLKAVEIVRKDFMHNPQESALGVSHFCQELGDFYQERQRAEEAKKYFLRYVRICGNLLMLGEQDDMLDIYRGVITDLEPLCKQTNDEASMIKARRKAVEVYRAGIKRNEEDYLDLFANECFNAVVDAMYTECDYDYVLRYAPLSIKAFTKLQEQTGWSRHYFLSMLNNMIGATYFIRREYAEAEKYLLQAMPLFAQLEKDDDDHDLLSDMASKAANQLGQICRDKKLYPKAEKAFSTAVHYAKLHSNEPATILTALDGLAEAQKEQGKKDAAKDTYLELIRACDRHQNVANEDLDTLRGVAYSWLSTYYDEIGQADIARDCYNKALALMGKIDAVEDGAKPQSQPTQQPQPKQEAYNEEALDDLARSYCDKGIELAKEGKTQEALGVFHKAIDIWMQIKQRNNAAIYNLAVAHAQVAHIHMRSKNDTEAIPHYRKAVAEWEQELKENTPEKETVDILLKTYRGLYAVCYRQNMLDKMDDVARRYANAYFRAQEQDLDLPIKYIRDMLAEVMSAYDDINEKDNICTFTLDQLLRLQMKEPAYQWDYAIVCKDYGDILAGHSHYAKARELYRQAAAVYNMANDTEKDFYAVRTAENYAALAETEVVLQHHQDAYDAYAKAIAIYQELGTNVAPLQYFPFMAYYTKKVGYLLVTCRMRDNAINAFSQALDIFQQLNQQEPHKYDDHIDEIKEILQKLG